MLQPQALVQATGACNGIAAHLPGRWGSIVVALVRPPAIAAPRDEITDETYLRQIA